MRNPLIIAATFGLVITAVLAILALRPNEEPIIETRPPADKAIDAEATGARPKPEGATAAPPVEARPGTHGERETEAFDFALPLGFDADDPAVAWAQVDLEAVRDAIPDNRFWEEHLPTDNPSVLEERARRQRHWREQRTRVESGNATAEEVDAYFEHQLKVYSDGVEFTSQLIENYADVLPERDLAMLKLARKLNRARLVELPAAHAEGQARRARLDRAREEWQAQQAAFSDLDDAREDTEIGSE